MAGVITAAAAESRAATLGAVSAKWLAAGLSTAPAARAAGADSARLAYRSAGLPEPRHVVWLASPQAAALAAALLTGRRSLAGSGPDAAAVAEQLRAQGCQPVPGSAGRSVRAAVRTAAWAAARAEAVELLGPDGWAGLWSACGADVWRLVHDRIATPLRAHLREELPVYARAVLLDAVGGQHDAGWLAAFDAAGSPPFAPEPSAPPAPVDEPVRFSAGPVGAVWATAGPRTGEAVLHAVQRLAGLAGVARSSSWWWPYANVAILTDRPDTLHRDNLGRLHSADTPALRYRDGFALHAWRGMPIPSNLVARLPRLSARQISSEPNAELRRVMVEYYGYERYVREAGARRVARDECGVLWRIDFDDDEPLTMVEVVNSTPEPDGTSRTYWLRVPPETRTAREGVAWTFGLSAEEYRPLTQT